jgi:transcriptional regulator with XRE-family HTH domain
MENAVLNNKAIVLLLRKFEESKQKNARWSQRSYAAKIGLSSGALSEILQGKRPLSSRLKKKISSKLQLSPTEESDFFEDDLPGYLKTNRLDYFKLTTDQFHLISDWWHYAILNLMNTKNFKPNKIWISERLGLSPSTTEEAWDRLLRLNLIKKDGKKFIRTRTRLETSDDLLNLSVQKSHLQDLELIEKSITQIKPEFRDHTSMTVVVNKKSIAKAKEMIRLFQDRFSAEAEVNDGDEVYKLSVSFFPLTKISKKNGGSFDV